MNVLPLILGVLLLGLDWVHYRQGVETARRLEIDAPVDGVLADWRARLDGDPASVNSVTGHHTQAQALVW